MNDKALSNIAQEEFLLLRAKERATQSAIYKVIKEHFLKRNPFKSKKAALKWLDLIADSFAAKRQHEASTYKEIRACHRQIKALERLVAADDVLINFLKKETERLYRVQDTYFQNY